MHQSSDVIPLPQDGTAAKTRYTVVVVGPSFSQKNDVKASVLAREDAFHLTAFAGEWQKSVNDLAVEEWILDIALPIVSSAVFTSKYDEFLAEIKTTGGNLKADAGLFFDFLAAIAGHPDINTAIVLVSDRAWPVLY